MRERPTTLRARRARPRRCRAPLAGDPPTRRGCRAACRGGAPRRRAASLRAALASLLPRAELVALARRSRSDRRRRRSPSELVMLIEGLALGSPRPTIAATHRQASEVAAQRAGPVPSHGSVHAIVTALAPGLVALAHERAKPLRQPGSEVSRKPRPPGPREDDARRASRGPHLPVREALKARKGPRARLGRSDVRRRLSQKPRNRGFAGLSWMARPGLEPGTPRSRAVQEMAAAHLLFSAIVAQAVSLMSASSKTAWISSLPPSAST
jgi:hypothetical protein